MDMKIIRKGKNNFINSGHGQYSHERSGKIAKGENDEEKKNEILQMSCFFQSFLISLFLKENQLVFSYSHKDNKTGIQF